MLQHLSPAHRVYLDRRGSTEDGSAYARINRGLFQELALCSSFECVSRETAPLALRLTLENAAGNYLTLTHSLLTLKNPFIGSWITIPYFDSENHSDEFYEQCRLYCDDLWFISEKTRSQAIIQGIPGEKTSLLNLGFDPVIFGTTGPKLDLAIPDLFIFFYVGSLESFTEIECMLEAYATEFAATDPVILLLRLWPCADSRQTEDQLRRLEQRFQRADQARIARLHGDFDDAQSAALYRTAHALLHPQRHDYGALQLIEAAASGLPIYKPRRLSDPLSRFQNLVQWIPESYSSSQLQDLSQWQRIMRYATQNTASAKLSSQMLASGMVDSMSWATSITAAQNRMLYIAERYPKRRRRSPHQHPHNLQSYEGMVFSQNGEDGMLYELLQRLTIERPYFVEIGAETGAQCNSAFFIQVLGASGLLIEADAARFEILKELYANCSSVTCIQHFATSQSIAKLLEVHAVDVDFDVLSIDIDGNDFHIWKALRQYRPKIVVIEYNASYPPPQRWTILDNPDHRWQGTSYYGASLMALVELGSVLGYHLLDCNSTGVNAIFLRKDLQDRSGFPVKDALNAYRPLPWSYPFADGPALCEEALLATLRDL